jgi:chromosome segregation ATPase
MQTTVASLDAKIQDLSTKLIERENEIAASTEKIQNFEEKKSNFLKDFEGLRKNFTEAKSQWEAFHAENNQWSEKVRECLKNELQIAQLGQRFAESIHHLDQNLDKFDKSPKETPATEAKQGFKALPKSTSSMRDILKKWEAEMDRLSSGSNSIDI